MSACLAVRVVQQLCNYLAKKKNVAATMAKESTNGKKENSQKPLVIWFLYNTSHVN
jgi:outer membrane lipoprotein-sorting protein